MHTVTPGSDDDDDSEGESATRTQPHDPPTQSSKDVNDEDPFQSTPVRSSLHTSTSSTLPNPRPFLSSSSSTSVPPPPPVSKQKIAPSAPMDDNWDLDAMLDEEEEERQRRQLENLDSGGSREKGSEFDADDLMWLDEEPAQNSSRVAATKSPLRTQNRPAQTASQPADDETEAMDEDMWDLINEVHQD